MLRIKIINNQQQIKKLIKSWNWKSCNSIINSWEFDKLIISSYYESQNNLTVEIFWEYFIQLERNKRTKERKKKHGAKIINVWTKKKYNKINEK